MAQGRSAPRLGLHSDECDYQALRPNAHANLHDPLLNLRYRHIHTLFDGALTALLSDRPHNFNRLHHDLRQRHIHNPLRDSLWHPHLRNPIDRSNQNIHDLLHGSLNALFFDSCHHLSIISSALDAFLRGCP